MAKRGRPKKKTSQEIIKLDPQLFLKMFGVGFVISSLLIIAIYFIAREEDNIFYQIINKQFGLSTLVLAPFLFVLGLIFLSINKLKFINFKTFSSLFIALISTWLLTGERSGSLGEMAQSVMINYFTVPGTVLIGLIGFFFSIILAANINGIKLLEDVMLMIENLVLTIHGLFKSKAFNENLIQSEHQIKLPIFGIESNNKSKKDKKSTVIDDTEELDDDEVEEDEEVTKKYDFSNNFESTEIKTELDDELAEEEKDIKKNKKDEFKQYNFLHPPTSPIEDDEDIFDFKSKPARSVRSNIASAEKIPKDAIKPKPKVEKIDDDIGYPTKVWEQPSIDIFDASPNRPPNAGNIQQRAMAIEDTLEAFGIKAKIADVKKGPAVTLYALDVSMGTSVKKITGLSQDLATRLESPSGDVRMVTPIPGTNLVGIEVPNFSPSSISLRSVLTSKDYLDKKGKLLVPIGQNVDGSVMVEDITKWPHSLVAGATGAGKSIFLNSVIASLLYRYSPQELRMLMIDPKFVELTQYNGIPHLLAPVVTDMETKAVSVFAWAVSEMDRRYRLFEKSGVRSLEDYNAQAGFVAEPIIVIVVDELADMMMVAAKEVETYITRLAQKSRATGIHLILATQRPTTNILTGTIKANVPTRIAFRVTSGTDSRVILDQVGAETLIGKGDMLYSPPNDSKLSRIQGVYVQDKEIKDLVKYLKEHSSEPEYNEEIFNQNVGSGGGSSSIGDLDSIGTDAKFNEALEVVINDGKASASYLQRRLGIGYARAARLIDEMEAAGIIGEAKGSKPRDILVDSLEDGLSRIS